MAVTTTHYHPLVFPGESKLIQVGATTTDVMFASTGSASVWGATTYASVPPTLFRPQTTAGDSIMVPIDNMASRLGFLLMFDAAASSDCYPCFALRKPEFQQSSMSPAWMTPRGSTGAIGMGMAAHTSTMDSGWKLISSTVQYIAAATQACFYLAGPFDAAKYAFNQGATSTNLIDIYQPYFEVMMGFTTGKVAGASSTHVGLSTGVGFTRFSTTQMISTAGVMRLSAFEFQP